MEKREGVWKCVYEDSQYPEKLKFYDAMPKVLYIRGELPQPDKPAVAIVGARACSRYGEQQAYRFGKILGENGVQVISGLARGKKRGNPVRVSRRDSALRKEFSKKEPDYQRSGGSGPGDRG